MMEEKEEEEKERKNKRNIREKKNREKSTRRCLRDGVCCLLPETADYYILLYSTVKKI
jgi:hypothetical protein